MTAPMPLPRSNDSTTGDRSEGSGASPVTDDDIETALVRMAEACFSSGRPRSAFFPDEDTFYGYVADAYNITPEQARERFPPQPETFEARGSHTSCNRARTREVTR